MKIAKEFGADYTVLVKPNEDVISVAKKIHDLVGDYPDKSIDCSGFEASIQLAIEVSIKILTI